MWELLVELLMNRLGIFILGVILIVSGIYGWKGYRNDARLYDSAMSKEGRSVEAEIAWKNRERNKSDSYREDGGTSYAYYFELEFTTESGDQRVKVYVDKDEYDSVELSQYINIRYPPENHQFVVTPKMPRPTVWLATIGFGSCVILGILLCFAVIISLF